MSERLVAGAALERQLGPGEAADFELDLEAGQFVAVEVNQRGVDVEALLASPGGRPLLGEDNLYGTRRAERLAWVAAESGSHNLSIRPWRDGSGPFSLVITEGPREATERDLELALAFREQWLGNDSERTGEERVELLARARDRFERLGEPLRCAEASRSLGRLLKSELRLETPLSGSAALNLERAIAGFERLEPRELGVEAELWVELGHTRDRQGLLVEAEEAYLRGFDTGDRGANVQAARTALLNLAQLNRRQGWFQRARDFGRRLEEYDDGKSWWAADSLGMTAFELGDLSEARSRGEELVELGLGKGGAEAAAHGKALLARVEWQLGHLERALELVGEAKQVASAAAPTSPNDPPDRLNLEAVLLSEQGRHHEALAILQEARAIYQRLGDQGELAMNSMNRGAFLERAGRPAEALVACDDALALAEHLGRRSAAASAAHCRARALCALGRFDEAEVAARNAIDQVEELRSRLLSPDLRGTYQGSKRRYYDLYVELLMRPGARASSGREERALTVSDQARARLLVESLGEIREGLRARAAPEVQARWLELRARAERVRVEGGPGVPADSRREHLIERELTVLAEEIRRHSPAFWALTEPPEISVERLQAELLPAESELLFYHLGPGQSFLWRVSHHAFESHALGRGGPLEEELRSAHDALATSDDPDHLRVAEAALGRLSERLLGPLSGRPLARRLLVVADGALAYVPFGLLRARGELGALLDEHEVVMVPSLAALASLVEMRARRPAWRQELVVIGDPVVSAEDPRLRASRPAGASPLPEAAVERSASTAATFRSLEFARKELQAILARAPAGQGRELSGLDASSQRLLGGALRDYRIVHFATHGVLDNSDPQRSRIVLSQFDEHGRRVDSSLRLADLYQLELSAELVVAGTCKSALGARFESEGLSTFTRGFLYAGASSVLVTLWNVDDEATYALMERFYDHLLGQGLTAASALRLAQQELRQGRRWRSPRFWAAFTLHGDPS